MKGVWAPQPGPQHDAILAKWCEELFFGGARGGGKSDFLLADFLQEVHKYGKHWRGVIFRRTYDELEELLHRARQLYPPTGAMWVAGKRTWVWENGATLKFRFLERDQDADRYQGHQYTWIGFDELTSWPTDHSYNKLKACLRSAEIEIPTKRIRASGNPGGVGHNWVQKRFVDPHPLGSIPIRDEKTNSERLFIRSRLQDNEALMERDPTYVDRLRMSGPPALVKAWLEGDWSAIIGAYFSEFSIAKHVIEPFEISDYWMRFGAKDWGSAAPFAVGWFAVSDGSDIRFPKNALIMYREWYGAEGPQQGLKMTAEQVADGILERTEEKVSYFKADPSMFAQDGGPSLAERMKRRGLNLAPADNKRIPGWDALRSRLAGHDEKPMIYFFSTCVDTIRTLPALQHDVIRPEDVDTTGEDHCGDMVRYACMSRPWTKPAPFSEPLRGANEMTLDELWKRTDKQRENVRI